MTITTTTATAVPSQPFRGSDARNGEGPARDAWQREMERAQARDWFRGTAVDPTSAPAKTHAYRGAETEAHPHVARARLPQTPVAWTTVASLPPAAIPAHSEQSGHTTSARPTLADGDVMSARATAAPDVQVPTNRRTVYGCVRNAIAPQRAQVNTTPGRPTPPIRAHVEWHGDTAHVWIGVDARGSAPLAAIAEAVLQRLRDQGLRVGRLVCNGAEHPVPASTTFNAVATSDADVVVHITTPREF
jgi:hypothetical protein